MFKLDVTCTHNPDAPPNSTSPEELYFNSKGVYCIASSFSVSHGCFLPATADGCLLLAKSESPGFVCAGVSSSLSLAWRPSHVQ